MDDTPNELDQPTAPFKPRRRRLRFGLRTLLILVTLAGCALGWLGVKLREARRQQADVVAIWEMGGNVVYDYEYDAQGNYIPQGYDAEGNFDPRTAVQPSRPAWLNPLLGDDFFRTAVAVFLSGKPVTDAALAHFDGLTHLRILWLDSTPLTDAGLQHLRGMTRLEDLRLSDTQVTDAGLEQLKRLTQLKWLSLRGTNVTSAGVANLRAALLNCAIDN